MRKLGLVLLALALAAPGARAWDSEGHMMVAAVAWTHLGSPISSTQILR